MSRYKRKKVPEPIYPCKACGEHLGDDGYCYKCNESPEGDEENSLFRESAAQILRHEELTGINRANWDEILHNRAKAHQMMFKTRGLDE